MITWFKWLLAGKELEELYRWRVQWHEYRRWLAEFKDISLALDNLKAEVEGQGLSASLLPSEPGPWTIYALREVLRSNQQSRPEKVSVSCPSCSGGKSGCRTCSGSGVVQVNAPPRKP